MVWLSERMDVVGRREDEFRMAIGLAFSGMLGGEREAVGFSLDSEKGFMLSGYLSKSSPFPIPLGADQVAGIVWEWLRSKGVIYFNKPDHGGDGTNVKGWRVYSYPKGDRDFFVGIQGVWIYLGK
jgi:hypothetical protein